MANCPICATKTTAYGDHVRTAHPLSCDEVRSLFEKYLLRVLDVPTEERVICHLAECKPCQKAFASFGDQKRLSGQKF